MMEREKTESGKEQRKTAVPPRPTRGFSMTTSNGDNMIFWLENQFNLNLIIKKVHQHGRDRMGPTELIVHVGGDNI
jgi:hypothetical protein